MCLRQLQKIKRERIGGACLGGQEKLGTLDPLIIAWGLRWFRSEASNHQNRPEANHAAIISTRHVFWVPLFDPQKLTGMIPSANLRIVCWNDLKSRLTFTTLGNHSHNGTTIVWIDHFMTRYNKTGYGSVPASPQLSFSTWHGIFRKNENLKLHLIWSVCLKDSPPPRKKKKFFPMFWPVNLWFCCICFHRISSNPGIIPGKRRPSSTRRSAVCSCTQVLKPHGVMETGAMASCKDTF